MTAKYDKYNKNGAGLCNAFGCRKHAKLMEYGKAQWCSAHLIEIKNLRKVINAHNGSKEEYMCRLEELRLRPLLAYSDLRKEPFIKWYIDPTA